MKFQSYDLGRVQKGATVVVTLRGSAANVRIMNSSNFSKYKAGRDHRAIGGHVTRSPYRAVLPSTDHWHVAVDLGGHPGRVQSSVNVLPPPLPTARSARPSSLSGIRHDPPPAADLGDQVWDVFISHASEDKDAVARPLHDHLEALGVSAWLDDVELKIGDSLRRKIDHGLAHSRFGVVVFSRAFFAKGWTQYELDGLVTRQVSGEQSLLPIWHDITKDEVVAATPSLADKIARSTTQYTVEEIAREIAEVVRPDDQDVA